MNKISQFTDLVYSFLNYAGDVGRFDARLQRQPSIEDISAGSGNLMPLQRWLRQDKNKAMKTNT
jgi:hypothetical protein